MERECKFEEVLLFSSLNDYQINEVCAILTENNIPFVRKDNGVGSYMNIYMGHSYQGKRVYVSKNDYDKSLELISIFTIDETEGKDQTVEEEYQTKNDRTSNTLTLISKIAIWTVLILPVLIILLVTVLALSQ